MALNFPSSPIVGQIYTSGGSSWVWDGISWSSVGSSGGGGNGAAGICVVISW